MALVIALALMTGLQQELRDRILGVEPAHLRLEDAAASPTTAPRPTSCAQVPHVHRRGAGDSRPGRSSPPPARRSRSSAQGHRPGARAAGHRHQAARCAAAASTALDRAGREEPDGILLGKRSGRRARRRRRRHGVGADARQGTLSPMGMLPRAAAAARRRHLQPRPVRVRLDVRLRVARRRQAAARQGPRSI